MLGDGKTWIILRGSVIFGTVALLCIHAMEPCVCLTLMTLIYNADQFLLLHFELYFFLFANVEAPTWRPKSAIYVFVTSVTSSFRGSGSARVTPPLEYTANKKQ